MESDADELSRWVIRLTEKANANLEAGREHFARTASEEIADLWREGMEAEIAKLSRTPNRFPIAPEDFRFVRTVRHLIYRRMPQSPAYRALFVLLLPLDESPTMLVMNIRHAAQKPMTRKEAREIEASE